MTPNDMKRRLLAMLLIAVFGAIWIRYPSVINEIWFMITDISNGVMSLFPKN